ncbi:MAG: ATP-dependent zinc metalloprotease FtsH [Chloroflexota bacterium]|nr:ATP-dependent zinc metalloprotease FtsH [Chloroflexota bacterium]
MGASIAALALVGLLVAVGLARVAGHAAALPIPASQAAQVVRSGEAQSLVAHVDRAFLRTRSAEYVFIKDREASVPQMLLTLGVSSQELAALEYSVEEVPPVTPAEILPLVVLLAVGGAVLLVAFRRAGTGALGFGRSRARRFVGQAQQVTFADVAGVAEAKEELLEIVEFLRSPQKFAAMGARIPRGVLLVGPPGTGKTLISRAVAGEAGVPFFSISGSEFVEMFVGVGASRVRDLFEEARKQAPSIIFIDEIDAVGRRRSSGQGGGSGHDEREQTLNQVLVEMDGFDGAGHVIVLAATNRPDVLDPALLRPGRFDRQVVLGNPDVKERTAILEVHARNKPLAAPVDLETLARSTPGFSGADLANLVNEAAILAVRRNRPAIDMLDLQEAIDRVIAGPQKKARVMSILEQRRTAYHEAGHAVVGRFSENHDPVHKVTIVSRGRMGGYTRFLPEEDRHYMTRAQFEALIASALGGWVAERLIFGDVSTGASNDIEKATSIARNMVTTYGMSDVVGPLALAQRESGEGRAYSERVADAIDAEVRALIDDAAGQAETILVRHRAVLDALAARLLDSETVEGDELEQVFRGSDGGEAVVKPLPTHRHRPSSPGLLGLPRAAGGLASTTLDAPGSQPPQDHRRP